MELSTYIYLFYLIRNKPDKWQQLNIKEEMQHEKFQIYRNHTKVTGICPCSICNICRQQNNSPTEVKNTRVVPINKRIFSLKYLVNIVNIDAFKKLSLKPIFYSFQK